MGITQEDSRFDFVGRVRMAVIFSLQLLIDMSFKFFLKDLRGFFNELSHENLFVFVFSGWIYLLCESNGRDEIKWKKNGLSTLTVFVTTHRYSSCSAAKTHSSFIKEGTQGHQLTDL